MIRRITIRVTDELFKAVQKAVRDKQRVTNGYSLNIYCQDALSAYLAEQSKTVRQAVDFDHPSDT